MSENEKPDDPNAAPEGEQKTFRIEAEYYCSMHSSRESAFRLTGITMAGGLPLGGSIFPFMFGAAVGASIGGE